VLDGFDPSLSLWVALGVSVVAAIFLIVARLHYLAMPRLRPLSKSAAPPDCMVIVPARNEAAFIADCVQSFPHDTVIVVDDQSDDETAEVARQAGAGVITAPDLPRGAVGKSSACAAGARLLTSKWILFADADARFAPGFLDAAVAYAESNSLALVSIYLKADGDSWGTRMLVPLAVALYFTGTRPRVNAQAGFNGQCILVRRDAYEFVGGHNAILTSRIDDVKLAALAERHRLKIAAVRAPRLGLVQFRGLWRTIERHGARFLMVSPLIGVVILIATFSLALWLPVVVWLLIEKQWMLAGAFTLLPIALVWNWYRGWRAIFAPVALFFLLPMIANGLVAALSGRREGTHDMTCVRTRAPAGAGHRRAALRRSQSRRSYNRRVCRLADD
jgi:chlorobactene glucosyltransferase